MRDHSNKCGAVFPSSVIHGKKPKDKPEHLLGILYTDCVRYVNAKIRNGYIATLAQADEIFIKELNRTMAKLKAAQEFVTPCFTIGLVDAFKNMIDPFVNPNLLGRKKRVVKEQGFGRNIIEAKVKFTSIRTYRGFLNY